MQYLYLHRVEHQRRVEYIYRFDDHRLSPNNLVIRKLFYTMLTMWQDKVTEVEIEYSDVEMVKIVGMEKAIAFLEVMGARNAAQQEYRRDGVLLSRTFTAKVTPERLGAFFQLQDLDAVYRLRFLANGEECIHLYFAETLRCWLSLDEEKAFLTLLSENRVPHKVLATKS